MENKAMLFSANGKIIKEIESENIKISKNKLVVEHKSLKNLMKKRNEILCSNYVAFILDYKIESTEAYQNKYMKKSKFDNLEVYMFDKLIFKGKCYYYKDRNFSLVILAEINNKFFKIYFKVEKDENITILKNNYI